MVDFVKYQGCGNDFVLVDAAAVADGADWGALARAWCDRHFGIGADQLLVTGPATRGGDIGLRIFNADGEEAGMCGNGVRCVARHVVERRGGCAGAVAIELAERTVVVGCEVRGGRFHRATVDMGEPVLTPRLIPFNQPGARAVGVDVPRNVRDLLLSAGFEDRMTCVSMGNPHAVLFQGAGRAMIEDADVARIGRLMEHDGIFPARSNVQFVRVQNRGELILRTWERGAGITLACGSGACAVLVAAVLEARAERKVTVHAAGGELEIEWDAVSNRVRMTGGAEVVFEGRVGVELGAGFESKRAPNGPE